MALSPLDLRRNQLLAYLETQYDLRDDGSTMETIVYVTDSAATFRNGEPLTDSDRVWLIRQLMSLHFQWIEKG